MKTPKVEKNVELLSLFFCEGPMKPLKNYFGNEAFLEKSEESRKEENNSCAQKRHNLAQ